MPDGHIRISGVWKKFDKMHVKVSGTWKEVQSGYVKVSGAWKQFFSNIVVTLSGETVSVSDISAGYDTTAGIRLLADGTIEKGESIDGAAITWTQIDSATDWIIPNGAADSTYDVRVTSVNHNGGPGWQIQAAADDTWIDLGSTRTWTINRTTLGTSTTDFTLEIRDDDMVTLASTAYQVECENTT